MKRTSHLLGPLLGLTLLAVATWVLFDKFREFSLGEFVLGIESVSAPRILLCIGLTAVYYLTITGYDALAFRCIGHPLRYRKIALGSFVGYAFSHNVGLTFLSSGSLRYRIYSSFGLTAHEIAKIVLFSILTSTIGFLTVSGIIFTFAPIRVPQGFIHLASLRPLGVAAFLLVILYSYLATHTKGGIRIWKFTIPHISWLTVLRQILLGSLEWILGSLIIYSVLPTNTPLMIHFVLEIYLLAQVAGLLSQVPGGLGVFESVLLLLLPAHFETSHILASLVIYRSVFNVLPLLLATIFLATHEVRIKKNNQTST